MKKVVILALIAGGFYMAYPKVMEKLADDASKAISEGVENVTGQTAVDLKNKAAKSFKKDNLERALKQYEGLRGKKPEELEELVKEGLLDKADMVDEWGRSLKVEVTTEGVVVRSAGKDGRFHTRDDWTIGES